MTIGSDETRKDLSTFKHDQLLFVYVDLSGTHMFPNRLVLLQGMRAQIGETKRNIEVGERRHSAQHTWWSTQDHILQPMCESHLESIGKI